MLFISLSTQSGNFWTHPRISDVRPIVEITNICGAKNSPHQGTTYQRHAT